MRSWWRETAFTILRGQVEGGGQGGDLHQGRLGIVTQGEGGNIKTPQSENNPPPVISVSVKTLAILTWKVSPACRTC